MSRAGVSAPSFRVYAGWMELLVVGLVWIVLGGLVMGGGAALLDYQASGSLMDQILRGLRSLGQGEHKRHASHP